MAVTRVVKASGLWTSPSFMSAPLGAFQVADDCVVNEPDLVEPRRGYAYVPYAFGTMGTTVANALFSFEGTVLVQYADKLAHDTGTAFVDFAGTNSPPDPTVLRMKAVEDGQNFYYTSTEGIKKIDTPTSAPEPAGTTRGPAPTLRDSPTQITGFPNTGWLPPNSQTAYVATWVRFDTDTNTEHEGQPSTAVYVTNPSDESWTAGPGGAVVAKAAGTDVAVVSGLRLHGFQVGEIISVTYAGAPDPNWPSGDFTITAVADTTSFTWTDGAVYLAGGLGPAGSATQGSKAVIVGLDVPTPFVDATYTVRVYRAERSLSEDSPPRFQFYLCNEHQLTGTNLTDRFYQFLDSAPDSLLGDPLYTNTDDGDPPDSSLQNDNSQPPYATDVCVFDARVWGANYRELQSFNLSLLGTGAPNGLQIGDTITIAGVTYTAVSSSTVTTNSTFKVFEVVGAPGENVQQTAQSLALAITKNPSSPVDCYYTSGVTDVPGQMLVRARTPVTGVFTINVSRVSAWGPEFTTALSSSGADASNGLWYSKQNQPEAVPVLNRLPVGPENCRVLRIQALRDKLFVFTDIAGIWVVTGKYPYENVFPLTKTTVLVGPDTLVNFNDALYALTTQGVAKVSDSGPQIISIPIETDIKSLFGAGLPTLRVKSVAAGYESYRKYILAMPTVPSDTQNTQAFVYDVVTKCWTRWTKPVSAMVIVPQSDFLYIASPLTNRVSKERKSYDRTDYADEDFAVNIVSSDGLSVTLTDATGVAAGDLLYVDPVVCSLVTGVSGNVLTMQQTVDWTAGGATIYPGIDNKLVYTPMFSGAPEAWKHYREAAYHFKTPAFSMGNALFYSDLNPAEQEVAIALGGFGDPDWEKFPWQQPGGPKNKRVYMPTQSQRVSYVSIGFHIRQAWNQWSLAGVTPVYEGGSERETTK